ncbi:hypothetical protein GCM10007860_30620 [Chitiniphilus shinanonensis]|uniref:Uncharacterized protein n=1 Tax=Chitiniphilus shinanonensis TaxID=553088 RepID=A0ABQ6BXL5_9NEIS|nr:hypothetical protein [Chitiniphilus shinanonensis]GLS05900.1 hypothetical protein GCM10007860_30620 [Chitiniphilus shinanonensis]
MSRQPQPPRHPAEAQRDLTETERAELASREAPLAEPPRQAPFEHDTGRLAGPPAR